MRMQLCKLFIAVPLLTVMVGCVARVEPSPAAPSRVDVQVEPAAPRIQVEPAAPRKVDIDVDVKPKP
jgi:hypothetical protein